MSMILMLAVLAAPQTAAATEAKPQSERRVCRKIVDTGSLVRGKRECRTANEWNTLANAARRNTEDMTQRNAGGMLSN